MDFDRIEERLASIYGGTPWIVVADAAAAATPNVDRLREWGVDRILVLAAVEGVGPQPDAVVRLTRSQGETIMAGFRAFARSLTTDCVSHAIADFDRSGEARILAPPFGAEAAFGDRRPYGQRRPEWLALEDKMVIDHHFEAAGVTTAPHAIVAVEDAPSAARALGSNHGTVWVADNSEGWHGGGEYVRWIRDSADEAAALEWFGRHARRVRVMPFLDGLPCSIHGYVTESGAAALRPVEMLIARRVDGSGFRYLGMATTWDPDPAQREVMRDAARHMGAFLDGLVRYRGPFSIDGVMTPDGFRPTELNPRMSAGFGIQAANVPDLRAGLLTRALVEGDIDVDPAELENVIVPAADRDRSLRVGIPFAETRSQDSVPIEITLEAIRRAEDEATHGTLDIGPALAGSYALLRPEQEHVPIGISAAPLAVSVARLAAETWDLALEDLEPARAASGRV
ncbi:MAG: ATP-grasp domain-containing protein [Acidimicrobiia bacterium]|nr:ATP-grasp domain-containing protein [Acidimicrobiia bacterium]